MTLPQLVGNVLAAARSHARITVMYVNVHCMNVRDRDPEYASILERSDVVYCDGTGVRLAAWLAAKDLPARMTGADWIDDLAIACGQEGLSLFLLGSAPGVAHQAGQCLSRRYPGLQIVGTADGFNPGPDLIDRINDARPDILMVGMGTPTQEKWIARHRPELTVPVVWSVGALFDFVTGRIPRGPRWMTDHGLEWLCRLAAEPRKLWRRYLIGNPRFFWRVLLVYWLGRRANN